MRASTMKGARLTFGDRAPHPQRVHPRKGGNPEGYRNAADKLLAAVLAGVVCASVWGCAAAYQEGYEAAEVYYAEQAS